MKNIVKKLSQHLVALVVLFMISACGRGASFKSGIVKEDEFSFGRIKIYKVYDEKRMREISSKCYISNNSAISDSALSQKIGTIYPQRFDYFLEHGLLVFKSKSGQELTIGQINCSGDNYSDSIVIRNFDIRSKATIINEIKYFGDVDIFISSEPDDRYVISGLSSTFYHNPRRILISNNQDEAYQYLATRFKKINKRNLKISYQPMKLVEKNETKDIPQSQKKMPF